MLVLSRKKGDAIVINDNIEISILEVGSDTVKIGISAPKELQILRKELLVSILESNLESANNADGIAALADKIKKSKNILPES